MACVFACVYSALSDKRTVEQLWPTQHSVFARYWLLQTHHPRNAATQRMLTWRVRNPWLFRDQLHQSMLSMAKTKYILKTSFTASIWNAERSMIFFKLDTKSKTHQKTNNCSGSKHKTHKRTVELAFKFSAQTPCHQECPWQQVHWRQVVSTSCCPLPVEIKENLTS